MHKFWCLQSGFKPQAIPTAQIGLVRHVYPVAGIGLNHLDPDTSEVLASEYSDVSVYCAVNSSELGTNARAALADTVQELVEYQAIERLPVYRAGQGADGSQTE